MGVTLEMTIGNRKPVDVTPGWRSMMYGLLDDEGLIGYIDTADIPALKKLAETQRKGEREPPFDWAQDIHDELMKIVAAVEKHGTVLIEAHF
jgi:hypothetical protein